MSDIEALTRLEQPLTDDDVAKLKEELERIRTLLSETQRRVVDVLAILYAPKEQPRATPPSSKLQRGRSTKTTTSTTSPCLTIG